jgi:hypothetical protein
MWQSARRLCNFACPKHLIHDPIYGATDENIPEDYGLAKMHKYEYF